MKDMITKLAALLNSGDVDNLPTDSANDIFIEGLNLVYYIAGAVAVIMIIVIGMMFSAAAGDQQKITTSRNRLIYAVTGLVVIGFAFTITQFIIGRF